MGLGMHVKTDSEVTSIVSSPPRSPRRPLYYVQSPSHSQNDLEKMSYGSSPFGSPTHHHFHYHCSPIHHSRESSTSRFSASLKNPRNVAGGWRMMQRKYSEVGEEEEDVDGEVGEGRDGRHVRFYVVCFVLAFVALFSIFSLILWGASLGYKPRMIVLSICFKNFKIQAGMDPTGVPTDMLTLNSTVLISYRNPATFFSVHVTSTPLELHYLGLKIASGHINKFYESRKREQKVIALVQGHQVPLYGGMPLLVNAKDHLESTSVPLNLTFVMRSRAYILGRLVKAKFYHRVLCQVNFRGDHLGKPLNLTKFESCVYR